MNQRKESGGGDIEELCRQPIELYLSRGGKNCQDVQFFQKHSINDYFVKNLNTDPKKGLSAQNVKKNKQRFGSNEIPKKQPKSFLSFFKDAITDQMLIILMVAAVLSIVLEAIYSEERSTFWIDGVSIFFAVAVCSLVASVNDYQKQKQFEDLSSIQEQKNKYEVMRDGQKKEVHRQEIVVGDVVVLDAGIEVPVDGFLLESINIIVDESAVTGESEEVYKDTQNKCLGQKNSSHCPSPVVVSSSTIKSGQGKMLAVVVGSGSQFGKVQKLIHQQEKKDQKTPLQQKLEVLADKIGYFGLFSAILIFVILAVRLVIGDIIPEGWNTGKHLGQILKYLIISVSIIVVAIPEGLPLAVTLSLAFSVKKMLSEKNLVRKLISCETMGGANYICTDKTGTLTQNKMFVVEAYSDKQYEFAEKKETQFKPNKQYMNLLLNSIYHNSSAVTRPVQKGSSTQIGLINFGQKLAPKQRYENYRGRIHEQGYFMRLPFNSDRKRMTTGVIVDERYIIFIKGASEIIVEACEKVMHPDGSVKNIDKKKIISKVDAMAQKGLRAVALAFKEVKGPQSSQHRRRDKTGVEEVEKSGFTLLLVVGIKDILRPETIDAINQCKKAGIKIIMVTGDSKVTAKAIAEEAHIITEEDENKEGGGGDLTVLQGPEFEQKVRHNENMSPTIKARDPNQPFRELAEHLRVVARSRPEHKYLLVSGLRKLGNVVAVTGDGTNDAPALLKADVGFAMGISGTQVARNAADIILLDDNFNSIVNAVVWGRNIYDSIRKFLQFQLTVNLVAVGLSLVSAALIRQSVLTAVQMLWVNLIMDSLASLALATQPPNKEALLNRKPHSRKQNLISSRMAKHIIGQAIFHFSVIMTILFLGHRFIPEYPDDFDKVIGDDYGAKYYQGNRDGGTVVNGAFYKINGDDAYFTYYTKYMVHSRHFTFIFNTFVMMQVFNFFNCRKIHDQLNLLSGLFNNWIYLAILVLIVVFQVLVVEFLGVPFKLYKYGGLNTVQWGISVGIASMVIPLSILLRLIPIGKEARDEEPEDTSEDSKSDKDQKSSPKNKKVNDNKQMKGHDEKQMKGNNEKHMKDNDEKHMRGNDQKNMKSRP